MNAAPVVSPGAPERPVRILVVDDDAVDRLIVRRILRKAGLEAAVEEAAEAAEGLERIVTFSPDCVLLDYNLPGQDGLAVLRAIRSAHEGVPVVVLTGQGDERLAVELMKAGAADYLPKASLAPERLAAAVRHAVELARAEGAARRAEAEVRAGAARARFLAEASSTLAESLEMRPMLERIVQMAVPLLGEYCLLYLMGRDGRLHGVASAHADPARARAARVIQERFRPALDHSTSAISSVIRSGRTTVLRDVGPETLAALTDDPEVRAAFLSLAPAAAVVVPLTARGAVRGSMAFARGGALPGYDEDEVRLAEDLGARTAVALDNAALYEEAQRARDRTERLQRITEVLATALPRAEVARLFVTEVRDALGAGSAWVGLLSQDRAEMVTVAHAGLPEGAMAAFARFPVVQATPVGEVLRTGAGRAFRSRAEFEAAFPHLAPVLEAFAQEAVLLQPLDSGGGVFGTLSVGFPEVRDFSAEDEALALAVSRQFAQALERARLYEAEREARADAERLAGQLAAAALAVAGQPTPEGVLAEIAQQARSLMGARAAVTTLAPYGGEGERGAGHAPAGTPAPEEVAVPLVGRDGRTLGAIRLAPAEGGGFTPADHAVLVQLAQMGAAALEAAHLYAAAQAARAEAEEANRSKSEFLARMSHDLRTPLNAIGGYAQLLELGVHGPVNEEQRGALERIRRAQEHLLALINDILSFARLEAGQVTVADVRVGLAEALRELGALVGPEAERRGLHLEIDGQTPLEVRADPERVVQVLTNLVGNALKFTPPGGRVSVRVRSDDEGYAAIEVADTGRGIPPERLGAIFEPFVQGRDTAEERQGGVGLGLAISRELARMMGGDLSVRSTEGAGSVFTLRLLAAETAAPLPAG